MSGHARRRILFATLALFLFACDREGPTVLTGPTRTADSGPGVAQPWPALIGSVPQVCGQASTDLLAGQSIHVGTVTVANDGDMLYVSFETTAGWSMAETHVAVASTFEGLPSQNGRLIPGLFPSKSAHDPHVTTAHYAVPLSALEGSTHAVVAAHADVVNGSQEGAWADGTDATQGGGWGTYVMYEIADCGITVEVGPEGGRIETDGIVLTIPEGALESGQDITVTPTPIEELSAPGLPDGVRLLPGTAFDLTPDGLRFEELVDLQISYVDPGLTPGREGALAIFTLRSDGSWKQIPGTVDPDNDFVVAPIEHFSIYVIVDTGVQFELRQGPSTYAGAQLGNSVVFRNLRTTPLSTAGLTVILNVDGPVSSLSNPTSTPSCTRTEPTSTSIEYTCSLTSAEIAPGSSAGWFITHLFDLGSAGRTVTVSGGYAYGTVEGVTAPIVTTVDPERYADVAVRLAGPEFLPDVGESFVVDLTMENLGPQSASPSVYEFWIAGPVSVVPPQPAGCFEPQLVEGSLLLACGDAVFPLSPLAPSEARTLRFTLVREAPEPVEARASIQVVDAIDTDTGNNETTWSCGEDPECGGEEPPPPPPEPDQADLSVTIVPPVSPTVGSPLLVAQTVTNGGPSDAPEDMVLVTTEVAGPSNLEAFDFDDTACDGFRVSSGRVRVSCVMPAIPAGAAVSPTPFSVTFSTASEISIQTEVRTLDPFRLVDPDLSNNETMLDVLITEP